MLSLIKVDLPLGGGITLVSMLPIVIISHRWGVKLGLITAFAHSVIQLLLGLDNVGYATGFAMAVGVILLDYILPYTALGLSGLFDRVFGRNNKAVFAGIAFTFFLRFACHYITGVWIWSEWMPDTYLNLPMNSPWIYSLIYNGWYMLFELILTEAVAVILYQTLGRYFRGDDLRSA